MVAMNDNDLIAKHLATTVRTDGILCKFYLDTKSVDEEERSVKSIITTDEVDRDLEVVITEGLDFTDFEKTRSVLFMHDPAKVVGKVIWIRKEKHQVVAKTVYAKTELGNEVWELVKGEFICGKSIGMDCLTMGRRETTPADFKGHPSWAGARTIIERAKVLEYSDVSIPANASALNEARNKGLIRLTKSFFPEPTSTEVVVVPNVELVTQVRTVKTVVRPVRGVTLSQVPGEVRRALRLAKGAI